MPLSLAGGGAAFAQPDAEWQKVIDAAKKEGKLVLYTSGVGSPFHKEVGRLFEQKYGIRFEALEARASELRDRTGDAYPAAFLPAAIGIGVLSVFFFAAFFPPLPSLKR